MITIEFLDGQGLGNQLWTYAAGRSIAEHLRQKFSVLGRHRFKGAKFLKIDLGEASHHAGDCNGAEEANSSSIFRERLYYDPDLDYVSSGFDDSVLSLAENSKLEGLFQSERYFFGNPTRCRSYIEVTKDAKPAEQLADDVCVLNLRGGEYKRHTRLILPKSYWLNAMANIKARVGINRFLIVTDDPRYARSLLPGIPVLEGGIAECYIALHHAKYVIVSNSSFSYFPLKSGRQDRYVIAPKYWSRFGNKHHRWASPANLYSDWLWQDEAGTLQSYNDCQEEQLDTERYYRTHYSVCTLPSVVQRAGLRRYIPSWLKKKIKRGLSFFSPRYIG